MGPWRDTHLRIAGPTVQAVQLACVEDWFWAAHELPELSWEPQVADADGQRVLAMPTGPADVLDNCELFFLEALRSARQRIWIASPYFVPDERSEEHTSELQSLMRNSYAVFCLKKKKHKCTTTQHTTRKDIHTH